MLFGTMLIVAAAFALFLGARAFSGPSKSKAVKRRLEMLKERHADGVLAANAQAQIRKLMAQRQSRAEGLASTLIPKPALLKKRIEQLTKPPQLSVTPVP